jgi:hypothetical protein
VTDQRWPRVKALFQAAVERPAEERDAFLAAATGDDAALRREVESLLASDTSDGSVLGRSSPAVLTSGLRVGPYEIAGALGAGAWARYTAHVTRN